MYINNITILLIYITLFILSGCTKEEKDELLSSSRYCKEKLPEFKVKDMQKEKLKALCKCIWQNFPKNSWERKASIKLYNGEDIGWRIKGFSGKFEINYKKCKKNLN